MRSALPLILFAAACGSGKQTPAEPATLPTTAPTAATAEAPAPAPAEEPPLPAPTKPVTVKSLVAIGLDPDSLDRTADPCDDFYQFACGGYIAKAEIPADKPITMRSFVAIGDRNLEFEKTVLETASTKPGEDPIMKQLGAYYGSCMNEPAIEKTGMAPIEPLLAQIDRVHDAKSLSAAVTMLHGYGINALFSMGPSQDAADATKMIADVEQGGLGLRDRDYYMKDDDQTKKVRGAYHDLLVSLLVDSGKKPDAAAKSADAVMALETEIAKVSKDKVARRDPKGMYNKIDRDGVAKAMPHFQWDAFWKGVGLGTVKDVNVGSPDFLSGVDQADREDADGHVARLPHRVDRADAGEHPAEEGRRSGVRVPPGDLRRQGARAALEALPRYTDGALGDLLGQAFVKESSAARASGGRGSGPRDRRRDDREPLAAAVDGRADQGARGREAPGDVLSDRLSEEVAHLLVQARREDVGCELARRRQGRASAPAREDR